MKYKTIYPTEYIYLRNGNHEDDINGGINKGRCMFGDDHQEYQGGTKLEICL